MPTVTAAVTAATLRKHRLVFPTAGLREPIVVLLLSFVKPMLAAANAINSSTRDPSSPDLSWAASSIRENLRRQDERERQYAEPFHCVPHQFVGCIGATSAPASSIEGGTRFLSPLEKADDSRSCFHGPTENFAPVMQNDRLSRRRTRTADRRAVRSKAPLVQPARINRFPSIRHAVACRVGAAGGHVAMAAAGVACRRRTPVARVDAARIPRRCGSRRHGRCEYQQRQRRP
jgi:hypothetical protein